MTSLLVILGLIGALVIFVVGIYNSLVQKRVQTENSWSQIDVQLKRRYDLIPNLVETVKGYASHEKGTLEAVINARSAAMGAPSSDVAAQAMAENQLTGALRQLFALAESYPDLKANENFAQLQEEIASTENRIGFARQHYNDTVGTYNTAIEQVPNNFVASYTGFSKKDFFEIDANEAEAVKKAPEIKF
ncbi:UNVERIFIED_CONTAM: hypothetical protein GTU68_002610 [Idotea baltica]|nr:hypothetical protein [Idotea baltica]